MLETEPFSELTQESMCIANWDGKVHESQGDWEALFGQAESSFFDRILEDDRDKWLDSLLRVLQGKEVLKNKIVRVRSKSGHIAFVAMSVSAKKGTPNGDVIYCTAIDVSKYMFMEPLETGIVHKTLNQLDIIQGYTSELRIRYLSGKLSKDDMEFFAARMEAACVRVAQIIKNN